MLPADNVPGTKYNAQQLSPRPVDNFGLFLTGKNAPHNLVVQKYDDIKGVNQQPLGYGVRTRVSCLFLLCTLCLHCFD